MDYHMVVSTSLIDRTDFSYSKFRIQLNYYRSLSVAEMTEVRILFFLYHFPPDPGSASKRNFRIAETLSRHSSYSHILTSADVKEKVNPASSSVIENIQAWDYRRILRRRSKTGALPDHFKQNLFSTTLRKMINSFPFNVFAGEGGVIYYLRLLSRGKQIILEQNITHIYSSFRPFTDHFAAYQLKKQHPDLFWIADFRDLPLDAEYNQVYLSEAHKKKFKKIFSRANLLTTVSEGLAPHLKEYNPNVLVVKNGIDKLHKPIEPVSSQVFSIVYTGSIYSGKRNAEPLFIAIRELVDQGKLQSGTFKIINAGKDGKYWKDLAGEYQLLHAFEDKDILETNEVENLQKQAGINVLLTSSSPQLKGVLTGKLVEYLEAGSPVLAIITGEADSELQSILHELEIGESFTDQPAHLNTIRDFIQREYGHWLNTNHNRKPIRWDILEKQYSMETIMRPLTQIAVGQSGW